MSCSGHFEKNSILDEKGWIFFVFVLSPDFKEDCMSIEIRYVGDTKTKETINLG